MRTAANLLASVRNLDLQFIVEESFTETAKDYIAIERDQMLHGFASDGAPIGKYKSDAYAQKKYQQNSEAGYGNVDLRLTGDFQNDLFIDPREQVIVLGSADSKSLALTQKYGDRIFGLMDDRKQEYIDVLGQIFQENISTALNK